MGKTGSQEIVIEGARSHNLKNISLRIPHKQLVVVTGISGSGKSSLVFEIIAKEGQRRYFETLPSFARQYMGKLKRPEVDRIEGLAPVIAIGQRRAGMHARSTVGTMSDIYSLLRLLFARIGKSDRDIELSRALFSFNSPVGKCQRCNGIGREEQIALNRLIAYPDKTIREGALAPTLPNGYIMYSQVTIDVLNQVCEAEGFSVDMVWNEMSADQQKVILYGSKKIEVPFGKHSLESRLKWKGIKAKPRKEGHYKGMIPIMSDILRRDRNANILKYVEAVSCPDCKGARLNSEARSVHVQGKSIAEIIQWELSELKHWIQANDWDSIAHAVVSKITAQIDLMEDLGLGHLTLDRPAKSLSSSEIQRIRLANQILLPLSDVLYVFDEPSIGLHPEENQRLIHHFKGLVEKGNTVIVVEHDLDTIRSADHIIELGPQAGMNGGELLFNGSLDSFQSAEKLARLSPTWRALQVGNALHSKEKIVEGDSILLQGCHERNLKNIDIQLLLGGLNVVSGKSGAGKSSLVKGTLLPLLQKQLGLQTDSSPRLRAHQNLDRIKQLIFIDHSPIGKTPRSNPATYLGLSDHIRDLYAGLPEAKQRGFTKSRFSFNNKGGRCEPCQGAGKTQIGMHFLGKVDLLCGTCQGDRFNAATLEVLYNGLSIADCYKLSISEALDFFSDQKKLIPGLQILQDIGLGYLTLGQSSTTLSGGEAQRIKIANQLQKKDKGETMYIIIEPCIGLHQDNIDSLMKLFDRIKKKGNTIVCIEQDESIIARSDWHIELGPAGGKAGGEIVFQGPPKALKPTIAQGDRDAKTPAVASTMIHLQGVQTHGLKSIDVRIPKRQLTVVTGRSGSGKSSLVYDTLYAEANARFTESLSTYHRSFVQQNSEAKIASYSGLGPAIAIKRKASHASKRSTVGTLSGIYDSFRLLYSRIAQARGKSYTAQHFSFNHHLGACLECEGRGSILQCDPEEVIIAPTHSLLEGACSKNKALSYYTDPDGQFIATLLEAAKQHGWNLDHSWSSLERELQQKILFGTDEKKYQVSWQFKTKARKGIQSLEAKWLGLCNYINEEYQRKRHNKNIKALESLMHEVPCPTCQGSRLKSPLLDVRFLGKSIDELSSLSIGDCLQLLQQASTVSDPQIQAICELALPAVISPMQTLVDLGLDYLQLNRSVTTLSGGEAQRLSLARQLSGHLFGVTYVLDEPSIGLDQKQIKVLLGILKTITQNGNTVVVVEHDPTFIKEADYLIELGPGAGKNGGQVVFQGMVSEINQAKHSLSYRLLHEEKRMLAKSKTSKGSAFGIKAAFANNLKRIDVAFHSQQVIAIKGVSGSGKSSLVKEVLYASYMNSRPVSCEQIYGMEQFAEVLMVDQELLRQSRLSTPLSYTGLLDSLKILYAKTDTAKELGLKKVDFSYLSKKGKCPTCSGHGKLKVSMDFMSDIWLVCHDCHGGRYSKLLLDCKINQHSIADVLSLTADEAIDLFANEPISEQLSILKQLGLGHLLLGQSATTLSGGEAQRLKLAKSLLQKSKGPTLYLFDEPSTGLHYFDILDLMQVFRSLIERGDTVLFIEHNSSLIDFADQVVALGPGSGLEGGFLIVD